MKETPVKKRERFCSPKIMAFLELAQKQDRRGFRNALREARTMALKKSEES